MRLALQDEVAKFKGCHQLLFTKTSELFKPITDSTRADAMVKYKQEASSKTVEGIQNDPKITNQDKIELISKLKR